MAGWSHAKRVKVEKAFYDYLNRAFVYSKDQGRICLGEHLYEGQRRLITEIFDALEDDVHEIYVLKSRQLGISTIIRFLTAFLIGINPGLKGAIVFDTDFNKIAARNELEVAIKELPASLKFPKVKKNNRQGLILHNDSEILFMSAGVRVSKTSGGLGRSVGLALAHCSELCSWADSAGLEAFRNSLSDLNPDRLYIYESTARGFNMWNDLWREARADPLHKRCIFLGWWSKDSQRIPREHRDFVTYGAQAPTEIEQKKIRQVKEKYGISITPEQLAWVRRAYDPTAKADDESTKVEYEASTDRIQEQPWCVVAGTRVGTDRGIIPIEEAVEAARCSQGRIVAGGPTGEARIWRVKTRLGYEFFGTGNHPLITTENAEVRLDSSLGVRVRLQPPMLREGTPYEVVWRRGVIESKIIISPEVARFVGLFMGDGSASSYSRASVTEVSICCDAKDTDVIEECGRLFKDLFGTEASRQAYNGWVTVRSGAKHAMHTIEALGLLREDIVRTARRVHVPEFIWRSPKHVVREFLVGLFEADGFNAYQTNRVALFSKYPEFIRDVQLLLLAFGITSRSVSMKKKAGDGHFYTGNQLELRTAEAIRFNEEIGFISNRKRARYDREAYERKWDPSIKRRGNQKRPVVVFEDEVVFVEQQDRVEQVWNLTVEDSHLFDANGILTHNTEDEAFQQSGAIFFSSEKLTDQTNKHVSKQYASYMFLAGQEFVDMRVLRAENTRSIELKVWEEPQEEATYAIGCDPAFGENPANDRSSIQVFRCYADGCDQVAEYAFSMINTRQLAWVLASLLGWYGYHPRNEVRYILELNGAGTAVWNEMRSLQQQIDLGYAPLAEEPGLKNVFRNVRAYINSRSDALGAGQNWHIKTTGQSKVSDLETLRDFTTNGQLHIRSSELIDEMKTITREDNTIKGAGTKKDDRVLAAAFALRCWVHRLRPRLVAARQTREAVEARTKLVISDQVFLFNQHALDGFFRAKQMDRLAQLRVARKASWRGRR